MGHTFNRFFFATPELAALNGGRAGLFYGGGFDQLGVQALSVVVCAAFAFGASYVLLLLTKSLVGGTLRVTEEEEILGLDMSEHGSYGYPENVQQEQERSSKTGS